MALPVAHQHGIDLRLRAGVVARAPRRSGATPDRGECCVFSKGGGAVRYRVRAAYDAFPHFSAYALAVAVDLHRPSAVRLNICKG